MSPVSIGDSKLQYSRVPGGSRISVDGGENVREGYGIDRSLYLRLHEDPGEGDDDVDELAEREALIEFNRQREKTPGQIVNEFEEMLEIEREKGLEKKT